MPLAFANSIFTSGWNGIIIIEIYINIKEKSEVIYFILLVLN